MSPAKSTISAHMPVRSLSVIALATVIALHTTPATADPSGQLVFLGWTADGQHSLWLSAVSLGQFEVESAKQSQIYDSWSQGRRGLHLTVSPEVQNGGTHKLYAYIDSSSGKRVLLDTDNQQAGHFTFPNTFPSPSLPSKPTLPPTGVMPTRPGGVQPPIATLPPTGVMPTRPGGVQPPIATLPPTGVMPTRPGGVQPPIATLPPTGGMPTLPGGVQPPIATLPPKEVMPTLPGGVQPPIGTLPPGELLPNPGLPQPLVPVSSPAVVGAGQQVSERALNERVLCVMADERAQLPPEQRDQYPDCPFTRTDLAAQAQPAVRKWSLWGDEVYYDISDHREGANVSGSTNVFSLGAETRLNPELSVGFIVSRVDSKVDSFNGGMRLAAGGYNIGPYLVYQASERWMLDATLMYGWMDNEQDLLFLSGDYGSRSLSGSLGTTGQYFWEQLSVRPRLALNYSHSHSEGYPLQGDYQGLALKLDRESDSYNQGNLIGSVEFSRIYHTSGGLPLMPYGELGVDYGFERPNDGYILTGNLDSARTEPLSGTVRLGLRTLLDDSTTLTTSAGYLSLGQDGLNIWEWRINLSKPF